MTIDLYYTPAGAPSRSVLNTAKVLGIKLNLKQLDMQNGDHLKPEFLKINPQHCIPTVVDNGFAIWESRAIITYLADKYAKNDFLYPKDAQKRAVILQRLFFDATVLYQRLADVYYPLLRSSVPAPEDKIKALEDAFEFLEKFLADSEYVAGSALTVADISLFSTVTTVQACDFDLTRYPNVLRWLKKIKSAVPECEESKKGIDLLRQRYLEVIKKK